MDDESTARAGATPRKESAHLRSVVTPGGHESSTLEEVGREIGLTRERVRQIQVEALKRLRDIFEQHGLSSESLFQ